MKGPMPHTIFKQLPDGTESFHGFGYTTREGSDS
jgi:hypothetical protein